jgi:hypothetical protein
MYIFQLMGGLGNQMFQYAAAKSLQYATGKPVKFDFDSPYPHIKYYYNLDVFRLEAKLASNAELWPCKPKKKLLKRLFLAVGKDPACKLVREKRDFHFDPTFFQIADGSYVSGFWQSEKYFKQIESSIRADFEFTMPLAGKNSAMADSILGCNAVSVHIRRGDYVNVSSTNKLHGTCSLQYYEQAIQKIGAEVSNPVFYFFSDDVAWVKKNITIQFAHHFVDHNDTFKNYEDLRLMSLCKHHIIANSSFSWWGAWLNPSKQKLVIAPSRWMNDPSLTTPDLIPAEWLTI